MTWLTTILENFIKPFKWWIVISPWESALRVRLGKKSKILNPGIHFRIPFLDRIFIQSIRLKTINISNINSITSDSKNITIGASINFSILNIQDLYNNLSTPDATIGNLASNEIIKYINSKNYSEVLIKDIESVVTGKLSKLACDWGFSLMDIKISAYALCKVYRLLNNDYYTYSSLNNLDNNESNGEKR